MILWRAVDQPAGVQGKARASEGLDRRSAAGRWAKGLHAVSMPCCIARENSGEPDTEEMMIGLCFVRADNVRFGTSWTERA
jgi:hypothetical protein